MNGSSFDKTDLAGIREVTSVKNISKFFENIGKGKFIQNHPFLAESQD
jgi:hypothetical protein